MGIWAVDLAPRIQVLDVSDPPVREAGSGSRCR